MSFSAKNRSVFLMIPDAMKNAGYKCFAQRKPFFSAIIIAVITAVIYVLPAVADMPVPDFPEEKKFFSPGNNDPQPRDDGQDPIICCMLATAVIETLFFRLCGFKERKTLMYIFFINLLSNLILNLFSYFSMPEIGFSMFDIAALETGVVLFEFLLLGIHTGWKLKIFGLLILSNALSYSIGMLFYSLFLSV